MNALYKRRKANQKGFTLIELIVVIAILVILAAVAIPSISGMQKQAKIGVIIANASEIANAVNVYNAANPGDDMITDKNSSTPVTAADLGDLAPNLSEYADASYKSVVVDANGIATVLDKTTIEDNFDDWT